MLKNNDFVPGHHLAKKSLVDLLINSFQAKNLYCQYFSGLPFENVNDEIYNLAISNLKNFYFVGKFEEFHNSFIQLSEKLNLENKEFIHINQNKYN